MQYLAVGKNWLLKKKKTPNSCWCCSSNNNNNNDNILGPLDFLDFFNFFFQIILYPI